MDEKEVKQRIRDWMYKWGYEPKGFPFFPVDLGDILVKGKLLVPFFNLRSYSNGINVIVDDLFELEVSRFLLIRNMDDYPFKFEGDGIPPKSIAFEYKGYMQNNNNQPLYSAIGQAFVYYYVVKKPVYLVVDIENYLRLGNIFAMLPCGIICYRVKGIDDGIKVIKHPNTLLSI